MSSALLCSHVLCLSLFFFIAFQLDTVYSWKDSLSWLVYRVWVSVENQWYPVEYRHCRDHNWEFGMFCTQDDWMAWMVNVSPVEIGHMTPINIWDEMKTHQSMLLTWLAVGGIALRTVLLLVLIAQCHIDVSFQASEVERSQEFCGLSHSRIYTVLNDGCTGQADHKWVVVCLSHNNVEDTEPKHFTPSTQPASCFVCWS